MGLLWKRGYRVYLEGAEPLERGIYRDSATAKLIAGMAELFELRRSNIEAVDIRRWRKYGIARRKAS